MALIQNDAGIRGVSTNGSNLLTAGASANTVVTEVDVINRGTSIPNSEQTLAAEQPMLLNHMFSTAGNYEGQSVYTKIFSTTLTGVIFNNCPAMNSSTAQFDQYFQLLKYDATRKIVHPTNPVYISDGTTGNSSKANYGSCMAMISDEIILAHGGDATVVSVIKYDAATHRLELINTLDFNLDFNCDNAAGHLCYERTNVDNTALFVAKAASAVTFGKAVIDPTDGTLTRTDFPTTKTLTATDYVKLCSAHGDRSQEEFAMIWFNTTNTFTVTRFSIDLSLNTYTVSADTNVTYTGSSPNNVDIVPFREGSTYGFCVVGNDTSSPYRWEYTYFTANTGAGTLVDDLLIDTNNSQVQATPISDDAFFVRGHFTTHVEGFIVRLNSATVTETNIQSLLAENLVYRSAFTACNGKLFGMSSHDGKYYIDPADPTSLQRDEFISMGLVHYQSGRYLSALNGSVAVYGRWIYRFDSDMNYVGAGKSQIDTYPTRGQIVAFDIDHTTLDFVYFIEHEYMQAGSSTDRGLHGCSMPAADNTYEQQLEGTAYKTDVYTTAYYNYFPDGAVMYAGNKGVYFYECVSNGSSYRNTLAQVKDGAYVGDIAVGGSTFSASDCSWGRVGAIYDPNSETFYVAGHYNAATNYLYRLTGTIDPVSSGTPAQYQSFNGYSGSSGRARVLCYNDYLRQGLVEGIGFFGCVNGNSYAVWGSAPYISQGEIIQYTSMWFQGNDIYMGLYTDTSPYEVYKNAVNTVVTSDATIGGATILDTDVDAIRMHHTSYIHSNTDSVYMNESGTFIDVYGNFNQSASFTLSKTYTIDAVQYEMDISPLTTVTSGSTSQSVTKIRLGRGETLKVTSDKDDLLDAVCYYTEQS